MHVYRLLGEGTVEEQIYKRQISKAAVVSGVCDDEQIATAYSQANPNPNPNPNHLPLALTLALAIVQTFALTLTLTLTLPLTLTLTGLRGLR